MSERRPGCLKSCLFGCGGVTALLIIFVLITAGLAGLKLRDKQPVDRDLEPVLTASDLVLDPARPGLLILDVGQGEMEIEPAPPGNALLNINTATAAELDARLPGIGPTKARSILDYRERNGPFTLVDELDNVHGIGPATIGSLRPLITVNLPGASKSAGN